jgi:2-iminobutanoate/2-iminopropanoate deaminase
MATPFSPFIDKNGFIFTSGQVYLTTDGKLLEGTIQEQTKQVMANLEKVLTNAGVGFKNVVKTTIYITDMSLYADVSATYGTYFTENFPAREMICVKELPLGARVEISMIASKE